MMNYARIGRGGRTPKRRHREVLRGAVPLLAVPTVALLVTTPANAAGLVNTRTNSLAIGDFDGDDGRHGGVMLLKLRKVVAGLSLLALGCGPSTTAGGSETEAETEDPALEELRMMWPGRYARRIGDPTALSASHTSAVFRDDGTGAFYLLRCDGSLESVGEFSWDVATGVSGPGIVWNDVEQVALGPLPCGPHDINTVSGGMVTGLRTQLHRGEFCIDEVRVDPEGFDTCTLAPCDEIAQMCWGEEESG